MNREQLSQAFRAALPIVVGYVALGVPAGILCAAAGMDIAQVALLAVFMYSGSGQYMIPNMFMAGASVATLSATVSLVSSRQMLYGSALSRFFNGVSKKRIVLFAATVTDESFGVNLMRFQDGSWTPGQAQAVNSFSHLSWTLSCVAGGLVGNLVSIPTAVAGFAMTSIFLCLLLIQRFTPSKVVAVVGSVVGVVFFKCVGLSGIAILLGALFGVLCGVVSHGRLDNGHHGASKNPRGKEADHAVE